MNWLEGNALVQTEFPISHIYPRLVEMLSGGTLSEADAQALLVLLQSATGEQGQQAAVNMSTGSAFDDPQPRLNIAGEVYCLTGDFAFGSRKAVKSYIETLGGTVSDKTVLASGCILVVGCKGSDAWLHSTHGSKIKDAVDTRGTCVVALANLRGGLAAHDPARLALAAEALSAVSLELSYCSGDAARMGAALTLCGEEEGGYAQ